MANSTTHQSMSGWAGWVGFASVMLGMAGIFHMLAGFVALFQEGVYLATNQSVWIFDYGQWGLIHIGGGLLALLAAGSLLKGGTFGKIFAASVAMISALTSMAFVPIYPIWSLVIIAVNLLVIWAVTVHGDEMKELED